MQLPVHNPKDFLKVTAESYADRILANNFVEVVRCKDCKHLTVHNSPTLYAYCEKTKFRFEPFKTDTRIHFCSYGERVIK